MMAEIRSKRKQEADMKECTFTSAKKYSWFEGALL